MDTGVARGQERTLGVPMVLATLLALGAFHGKSFFISPQEIFKMNIISVLVPLKNTTPASLTITALTATVEKGTLHYFTLTVALLLCAFAALAGKHLSFFLLRNKLRVRYFHCNGVI